MILTENFQHLFVLFMKRDTLLCKQGLRKDIIYHKMRCDKY